MVSKDQQLDQETTDTKLDLEQPEGWAFPRISDILTVSYGKGLKKSNRKTGMVPVYGSNGVVGRHNSALTAGPTIILGRKGTVGAVNFSTVPCWPIDTSYFIDKFHGLVPQFIFHAMRSLNLGELDTSTAIPGLNRNDIYRQQIPLPPIPEQKRIVAKVEELLARVNAARERLAKVKEILKRFRQSVLATACSGRLTADWRGAHLRKVEPAGQRLKRRLDERRAHWEKNQLAKMRARNKTPKNNNWKKKFKQPAGPLLNELPELPENWCWGTIEQMASTIPRSIQSGPFGSNLHHSEFRDEGILAIGIDNVVEGKFSLGREHRISEEKYKELRKYTARPSDVLITVMGTVGRCCVVPEHIETAIITKHVYRITVDQDLVLPSYLIYALRDDAVGQRQIQDQTRGQTRPGINKRIVKSLAMPTPPLEEQNEIVRRVGILFKMADTIEKRLAGATEHAEKLTQVILAKAFRGELVPTEAELARHEGRLYEPAPTLLSKIKALSKDIKIKQSIV